MRHWFLILALAIGLVGHASAQERASLLPEVPKATGEPHPEGNEFWRRNHMELMRHDRDQTVYLGDREIGASLSACFECHAATDDAGAVVTYESEQHFCRACHDYAAVKVDCFMCHRSTPEGVDEGNLHALTQTGGPDPGAITAFFNRLLEREQGTDSMTLAGSQEALQ